MADAGVAASGGACVGSMVLRAAGPALLFENPTGHRMPVLDNLFGTPGRVARALGVAGLPEIRAFGEVLASLKETEPPRGMQDLWGRDALVKTLRTQVELLERELRSTAQRVNLFEKVKIPEARENIRVIGIYLGDQQTSAVVRGKIAKKKLQEAAR